MRNSKYNGIKLSSYARSKNENYVKEELRSFEPCCEDSRAFAKKTFQIKTKWDTSGLFHYHYKWKNILKEDLFIFYAACSHNSRKNHILTKRLCL